MPISELVHINPHETGLFVSCCGLLATNVFFEPSEGGEQQNITAQYSSANMIVMTRSVTDGSAGSGE